MDTPAACHVSTSANAPCLQETPAISSKGLVQTVHVTVRANLRGLTAFGRGLAWCCGVVASVEEQPAGLQDGELVNVCIQPMTRAAGADMRLFARDVVRSLGELEAERPRVALLRFACERREEERNGRGAIVLHAVEYFGVTAGVAEDSEDELDDPSGHKEDKTLRHAIFASWLVEHFGAQRLASGAGILDVAAGKGKLSAELRARCGESLKTTLVEPALRQASMDGVFVGDDSVVLCSVCWLEEEFDATRFPENHNRLLTDCSAIIGLHPDQPTEAIVDLALAMGKPFAVVPCCVYPGLFPNRRTRTGQGVVTYHGFLLYLKAKDPRIRSARLPFKGRNRLLYLLDYGMDEA